MSHKRLSRTTIYESEWVSLHADRVELPSGTVIERYHVVDFPKHSVAALVLDDADRVLLVRIHRYPVGATGWEVPAGGVDPGETAPAAAAREVREETGTETAGHCLAYTYHPSNGVSNQVVHVVRCRAVSGTGELDTDEVEGAAWFTRAELDELLARGEIRDGLTLVALFCLMRS